jgi:hypothetical protein
LGFFETLKSDTVLSQRIIGVLPTDIHQVYLQEREAAQSRPQTAKKTEYSGGNTTGFFKEVLERGDE